MSPAARARRRGPARALLVSLLLHVLLLTLVFSGDGVGLPGLSLPWQARRADADLRVVLMPTRVEPAQAPVVAPDAEPVPDAPPETAPVTAAVPKAEPAPTASPDVPPPRLESTEAPLAALAPALIAVERPARPTWTVPPGLAASAPVVAAFSPDAASAPALAPLRNAADTMRVRAERAPAADLAKLDIDRDDVRQQVQRLESARADAERAEAARLEAERQQAAQDAARRAAQQDAARQQAAAEAAAKQAALQQAAARAEAERQDAARRAAAQQEAARQDQAQRDAARAEAERQEAARRVAAQQDAARQETARQDAARADAARQDAARAATAKLEAARAAEEQREARLRAIGRQLDEEAARRDAAAKSAAAADPRQPPSSLPTSWSTARRGRLLGRIDTNAELVAYAEAWARKIQFNAPFDLVRDALKQPHGDALVTVAIRSDGSVESVSFYRSSGVPALDDAIRKVIQSQERYPAFPPALLRDYDVIEIRRTWQFDTAIRLY